MSARAFGFTLAYRPVGPELVAEPDTRPVERLPRCQYQSEVSEEQREKALAREVASLEAQGYRVEAIERWNQCAACHGCGRVQAKLGRGRGARLRFKACPSCGGGGAEHQAEPAAAQALGSTLVLPMGGWQECGSAEAAQVLASAMNRLTERRAKEAKR